VPGTGDLRRLRDGLRTVQEWLVDVRVTAESDDGLIRVTVSGRGELLDLDLDPRIYRTPDSRALATAITATVREAKRRAAERAAVHTRRVLAPAGEPAGKPAGIPGRDTGGDPAFDPLLRHLDRDIAAREA
jgi:DNA-binding protein YbaB